MIVKFFKRGTGKASGVFNYLLKDSKEPDGQRQGAELLRGDVVNQSLLIDSLPFKQRYTSGCLSFAESPDEITEHQKNALMDTFEETIRAGLDADRIAVTWVEHRDKGRLELNFVFANVDLLHGRAFQPYVHSQDKKRVNAWKDMQNITYGFKDPNDPANKRLMAQRDNLPRDVKQARQAITDGLTALVEQGVIKSRDDVVQTLTDNGFEIARETPKAISIQNPEGGRNIRLTGGLYERDFNFSREIQAELKQDSREYRSRSSERYESAKQLYDRETQRKREYHQVRHGRPKRQQRAVTANARATHSRYEYSPYKLFEQRPSPFNPRFKRTRKSDERDDRRLHSTYREFVGEPRQSNSENHQSRREQVVSSTWNGVVDGIYIGNAVRSKIDHTKGVQVLSRQQVRSDLYATDKGLNSEQTATRTGSASAESTAKHNTETRANAQRQRQGYSRVTELVKTVNTNADRGTGTFAELAREIEEHNQRAEKSTSWLDSSTQNIARTNEQLVERHNRTLQRSNSAHKAVRELSEYDSARKHVIERYRAVREQIERIAGNTEQNKQYAERNQQVATANTDGARLAQQLNKQVTEQLEQQRQQVRSGQGYRPRMR